MKIPNYRFFVAVFVSALAMVGLSQSVMAQRFSHPSGGGGGNRGGGAPAPAARPAMTRPMPVARQEMNRPAPAPMRTETRPAQPVAPNPSINGGSRNIGRHDFGLNNNTAPGARPNSPGRPAGNPVVTNPQARNGGNAGAGNGRGNGRDNVGHVNAFHTGSYRGLRPYAYHPYHPYYWGPRWHPFGFFLGALAANAIRFSVGSQYYYYDDGSYYVPSGNGYSTVPPPIGAVVSYLPDGYETTMVGDDTYYYYAGAFYIGIDQGYQVVQAPPGAVVSQLPDGAVDQQINGEDLLVYNNVYYEPISQDGQDAYQVVQGN
jgi:hypothetical protein